MSAICTFCSSNQVTYENRLAQCKSCYRSWIYKKTQTYDFDDIFGSVDDLFQKNTKKRSIEKKKPTPVLLKSTEKPTQASSSAEKRKKEPSPALEREVYDEGLFSDMDDDKDTTIQKHLDSETKSSALSKENSPRQRNNKESAKDDEYRGLKNSTIQQQSNDDSIVVKQEKPMMKKPTLQRKTSQKNAFSIVAQGESKKSKEKIEQQAVEEELPGKQKDNPEPPEEKYELRKKRAVKEGAYFLGDDHTTCEDEDDEYIEETGEEDMYEAMDEDFSDEGVMGNTQVNEQPVNVPDKTERIAIKTSTKSAKKKNQSISEEENEEYEVYDLMDATRKTLKGSRLRKQPNSKKTRKPGNKFNPYLLFNKEMRPKIQELHPDASIGELSKIIGKRWKDLDPEKKEAFLKVARENGADYEIAKSHPNLPKPPPNVWIVYCKEESKRVKKEFPTLNAHEVSKVAAQRWKALSEEEKNKYRKVAQDARDEFRRKYPEETKAFYDKMTKKLQKTRFQNNKANKA